MVIIWGAVGAVALLILVVAAQFMTEMRRYGLLLLRESRAKSGTTSKVVASRRAGQDFFFSFTGVHNSCGFPWVAP